MKWNNKFIYPKSSRSIEDGLRKYLIEGEKLQSITSLTAELSKIVYSAQEKDLISVT